MSVKKPKFQTYVDNVWNSSLCMIGSENIPDEKDAGNVLREFTTFKFNLSLCPTLKVTDVQ